MCVSGKITVLRCVLEQGLKGPVFPAVCFPMRITHSVSFAAAVTPSSSVLTRALPNDVATVLGSLDAFSRLALMLGLPFGGFLCQSSACAGPCIFRGYIVLPTNVRTLRNCESDPGKQLRRLGAPRIVKGEEHSDECRGPGAPVDLRLPIPISPQEPQVALTVGDKPIDFLTDMGATYSVVNTKVAPKTPQSIPVTGVSGEVQKRSF